MKSWDTLHHRLTRGLAVSAACIALSIAAPAQAFDFDVDWTFNGSGEVLVGGDSSIGNSRSYQSGGPNSVSLRATGWSDTGAYSPAVGNSFEAASLRRWSGGFAVQNKYSNDSSNPEHAIDNNNNYDFVVFELDRAVNLSSVTMNAYGTGDSDITVWVGNTDSDFSTQFDLTGMDFSDLDNMFARDENYVNGGSTRTALFPEDGNLMGNVIIVAATILPTYNGKKDYFKLKQLAGGYDDTPSPPPNTQISEPSSLAVIAFGLAGICFIRRRRNTV